MAGDKQSSEKMLIEDMASMSADPLAWVHYSFPWGEGELAKHPGPDAWQTEILAAVRDGLLTPNEAVKIAVASGHGIGKSALVSWLILWALSTMPDAMGVITANTDTQLRTKTWANVAKWYRLCICKHWFTLTATSVYSNSTEHEKTWRVDAIPWSIANTQSFAGLHNEGKRIIIIFDEASTIADEIWDVTKGALTDTDTEIIWCAFGNPTENSGAFKEAIVGNQKHRWRHWQIDSRTSRIANKAYLDQLIEDHGIDSDIVKIRVRGMFPSMSAKQFYATDIVDAAFGRELRPDQYDFAPVILTCDPAWQGDDMLEIGRRQGLTFRIIRTIPKNDNDIEIANILAALEDEHRADAVFIDGGFGTGIYSAGKTWGRPWHIVWFGGKAGKPGYFNKRSEMAADAKQWLMDGGALDGKDQELRADILCPELIPQSGGVIRLESKPEIKQRLKRSPGKFDAFILSFAFPVYKKMPGHGALGKSHINRDYDPYKE